MEPKSTIIYDSDGPVEFEEKKINDIIIEEPTDIALLNILADMGVADDDTKVNVYRAGPVGRGNKGSSAFLFSCTPSEFSLEQIRDGYGSGKYRIYVRKDGHNIKNSTIEIEENKKNIVPVMLPNMELAKILETMQTGFNQLGQMLAQTINRPVADTGVSRRELLQEMAMMREMFAPRDNPANSVDNSITMLMKGLELARDIAPRTGEASTADIILEGLKTFGKPIAEAAMTSLKNMPAMQTAPSMPPGKPFNAPVPLPSSQINPPEAFTIMIQEYANTLLELAKADKDPYVYAVLLCDNAQESDIQALLNQPDLLDYIIGLNAGLNQYKPWLAEFIDGVREVLTPDAGNVSVNEAHDAISESVNNASVSIPGEPPK